MKKFKEALKKPWAAYTFAACSAVVLFLVLSNIVQVKNTVSSILSLFTPVFIGLIVAYLFNPVSSFFERTLFKKMKKELTRHISGVIITIVLTILILAVLLLALIPSLVKSISKLISNWSVYTTKIGDIIKWAEGLAIVRKFNIDFSSLTSMIDNSMSKVFDFVKGNYKSILSTVGDVGKGVTNFVVGILFGFCFLISKGGILKVFNKIRCAVSPKESIERRNRIWSNCNKIFIRYVGSTLLDALIIGVLTLIFLLIAKMPYAPLIAVVVAITNIIPTFGPLIGNLIGCFFIVLESPIKALIFFAFICVLQAADGMLIKPKLFSNSLGIPAVWTLVLIILGGKLFGMAGILLAVPFAAILVILYQETVVPRLEKRTNKINKASPPEENPSEE